MKAVAPSARKTALFWAATLALPVVCAAGLMAFWRYWRVETLGGAELNRVAWEASFSERGGLVPKGGPRDGYWGTGMPDFVAAFDIPYIEAEVHRPGFVEENRNGMQDYELPLAKAHILVVGGSVGWGAYASREDETYFAHAAKLLGESGWPVHFTILAAGAWTSDNEFKAFRHFGLAMKPDVVVFLDGLNDITQRKGTPVTRVTNYVDRLHRARDLAETRGFVFVIVLQPALSLKRHKSHLERRIVDLTPKAVLVTPAYERMRAELGGLADDFGTRFVDCSDALSFERPTTFSDIWHFGDHGHRLLGRCLAQGLLPVLKALKQPKSGPEDAPSGR